MTFDMRSLRYVTIGNLVLVIDGSPAVDHLAIQPQVHLVGVPAPVATPAHARHALSADVMCEHWPEPVLQVAHCLAADVDDALER